jgi:AraC family transcriptional regulator of adaptative response / DNA-3-methyladenine glycosylase II
VGNACGVIDVNDAGGFLRLALHGIGTEALFAAVQRARGMFDLDAPVDEISKTLSHDPELRQWLKAQQGLRVPGAWDGFELTVRAVLGQQVSVKAATTFAGRIAARYGDPVEVSVAGISSPPNRLFPEPAKLVRARLENLGIIRSRAQTIRNVARAVADGILSFDAAQSLDEIHASLKSIKGIGEWTAEYVAMRALKNPDAFPAADLEPEVNACITAILIRPLANCCWPVKPAHSP